MKKTILIFGVVVVAHFTDAQSLKEFKYLGDPYDNELYLNVCGTFTLLRNNAAPYPEAHKFNAFSMDISGRNVTWEKGKPHYTMNYKLLPDLLFLTGKMINRKSSGNRTEGSSVSTGIGGWHRWAWNIAVREKQCVSLGFALNDYFIGNSYRDSSKNLHTYEPQGWWISSGPVVMYHRLLHKHLLLHSLVNYNFGFLKGVDITYAEKDPSYPKPHFFHIQSEIISSIGIFAGFDYTRVINRGNKQGKVQRLDFLLGYKFVL